METSNLLDMEYLNPYSDNYFRGYKHVRDENNTDKWYDEDGNVRKRIHYYSNGEKWLECYYNNKGELHNEEDFAFIVYDIYGFLSMREYYLNDKMVSEEQWNKIVTNNRNNLPISENTKNLILAITEYQNNVKTKFNRFINTELNNVESPKYYKGFKYQKKEDGDEFWLDTNGIIRKEISYYGNGNKYCEYYYNEKGELHNEEDVTYKIWNTENVLIREGYYIEGKEISQIEWLSKYCKKEMELLETFA